MLALLLVAAPKLVLVPEGGAPPQCEARERLAAAVALAPDVRVLRVGTKAGEDLRALRRSHDAWLAVDGAWAAKDGANVLAADAERLRSAR
ncbi:MAG: hypothetical protein KC933_36120, partial [Myxococcales bacterium]|nr:hypothetical protein [Myxococcales bacterium]